MKLIFVYNADSGAVNAVVDGLHKALSPATYSCSLCALTHNSFGQRRKWKEYRRSSGHELVFLHRDEFEKEYRSKWLPKYTYPVVLEAGPDGLQILVSDSEIAELDDPAELIELLNERSLPG